MNSANKKTTTLLQYICVCMYIYCIVVHIQSYAMINDFIRKEKSALTIVPFTIKRFGICLATVPIWSLKKESKH